MANEWIDIEPFDFPLDLANFGDSSMAIYIEKLLAAREFKSKIRY